MGVHADGEGFLAVFVEGVGRHGDDGDSAAAIRQIADELRRLIAVHVGHLDVHEDGIIIARRVGFECLDAEFTVGSALHGKAALFQNGHDDLCVEVVVLGQQDAAAPELGRVALCILLFYALLDLIRQWEPEGDGHSGSCAQLALHVDAAVHPLHESLHDGQAQAGADDFADSGSRCPEVF